MADISPYTNRIANAVYGEEVRSSIIDALNKVNDDNNSYQEIKDEITADKEHIDEVVEDFGDMVSDAQAVKTALDAAISSANTAKTQLETATSTANTAKTNLQTATTTANTAKSQLQTATSDANTAITNAGTAKTQLETATSNAGTAKSQLNTAIGNAETALSNLNTAIGQAATSKTNLEGTISSANTAKTQLQAVIDSAETAKSQLSTVITNANTANTTLSATVQTATDLNTSLTAQNGAAVTNIAALDERLEDADEILTGIEDIKAYLGYTDEDIAGICVDYQNKTFKRLAGAYDKNAGSDFDTFPMFGGRRRCNVSDDGTIVAYYGDNDYAEDGSMGQVMVYQPKFYYKVVPLVYDKTTRPCATPKH